MRRTAHLSALQPKSWKQSRKDVFIHGTIPLPKARGSAECCVLVCVCMSAHEIPPKIPNEPQGVEWQPAHGALKQQWINLFPHTVNHIHLRWGLGKGEACRGQFPAASAFLSRPPAVKGRDEGASNRDGNPSNQTTQVVHLGGRLYLKPYGKQKKGGFYSPSLAPEANNHFL